MKWNDNGRQNTRDKPLATMPQGIGIGMHLKWNIYVSRFGFASVW